MKHLSIAAIFICLLSVSNQGKSQKSTSGYILFGKNKTEASVVCSQSGICKLQQLFDPEYIPVTFTAMPLNTDSSDFSITMTVNLSTLAEKQPQQDSLFRDKTNPYVITDNFSLPAWLITGLGFDRAKNKFITLPAPISLGIPSSPNAEGNITLTLTDRLSIVK